MTRWTITFTTLLLVVAGLVVGAASGPAKAPDSKNDSKKTKANEKLPEGIVSVRVTPKMAFGPVLIRALVQVQPNSENRLLRITIDSGSHYRSTDIQLDGADAAKTHEVTWPAVPPGSYTFSVILFGPSGARDRFQQREYVILSGQEP